ncbi:MULTISPECIES: DNA polymerase III subunit beta [Holospora]|uniref:Beta sliding clamp n=2 Tax=Holospora TaxID=44747 RepID=A0A061JIU8_9PROT|nr:MULTISPECIES: DNA polymerase III subunit beta [Holospora]ETZ05189.1 DNA polymerase III subunit beta [Holospora undulata HU1]GAJ46665.1 DNA polymerase III subunit beta [Holospora elegans E1]
MRICVEKAVFSKILTHQQLLINRRSTTVPILSHILIKAHHSEQGDPLLSVQGTDMEMSLWETEVIKPFQSSGASVVCAHLLYEIVRKIDDQWVTLEGFENHVTIQGGAAEFHLPTLPVEEFPLMETQDLPFELLIDPATLADVIKDTSFCVATEETRYALAGTCFHFREDSQNQLSCNVVATDGHRLALSRLLNIKINESAISSPASLLVIGRRTIQSMLRLLESDSSEEVSFRFSANQVSLQGEKFQFFSRLLIDRFPDYIGAIPKNHVFCVQFDPKELMKSLDRVSMVIEERTRSVKLTFCKTGLVVSANSAQGSAKEVVKISYDGEEFTLIFNVRYLSEICQHARGNVMTMEGTQSQNPVLFQEINRDTLYVLMPISS